MKIYPEDIEERIGFDKIRAIIDEHCLCTLGKKRVSAMHISDDADTIKKQTSLSAEFCNILASGHTFPTNHYVDPTHYFDTIRIEGAFLEEEEIYMMKLSLQTIFAIHRFCHIKKEAYPTLYNLSQTMVLSEKVLLFFESIDEKGKIHSSASPQLTKIRQELHKKRIHIKQSTEKIFKSIQNLGYVPENSTPVLRSGRVTIPIIAEYKRKIKGIIHDESATGQTAYIEPIELVELHNELKELEISERREIVKILTKITHNLREHFIALTEAYNFLGEIDFIRAKTLLATDLNLSFTALKDECILHWNNAFHPLFFFYNKDKKKIIPFDISLHKQQKILIISGPNAGGKTLCLTSIALIQYMHQCGLLVPMQENSSMGIFSNIFIDIGDQQSLEKNLSTYSSHLTNMKYFLENSNEKTIFLVDEFGVGTDPQFGGAIAESILLDIYKAGAYGAITTHYGNLKKIASHQEGIVNASMRYDTKNIQPLYELKIGSPGNSFALEIARKIGIPLHIIDYAQKNIGDEHIQLEILLAEVENLKQEYKTKNDILDAKNKEVETLQTQYKTLKESLEKEKKNYIKQATLEAKQIVTEANKKIEKTISEIKEKQAEKKATSTIRKELQNYTTHIEDSLKILEKPTKTEQNPPNPKANKPQTIQIGDTVIWKKKEIKGEVVAIKGEKAEVRFGNIKTHTDIAQLEKTNHLSKEKKNPKKHLFRPQYTQKKNNLSNIS